MPATWLEFRDLAKELLVGDDCSESKARASIGRSYYAAFHALKGLCELVPGDPPKYEERGLGHRQIAPRLRDWRLVSNKFPGLAYAAFEARTLASVYSACLEAREIADYDLDESPNAEVAKMQLARVQELLNFSIQLSNTCKRLNIEP